jgi:hypothetical protein
VFGHHRAGETFASDVAAFVHQVPVPIWVATIGVLAAAVTPLVQYLVARSREKSVARADERRRSEDLAQTTTRVRADLLFRLRAHLVLLGALAETGTIDVDRWQQAFERFAGRTREADVIEALGRSYHDVVQPVHAERVAIEVERSVLLGARASGVPSERIAAVRAAYAPVLELLSASATSPTLELGRARH